MTNRYYFVFVGLALLAAVLACAEAGFRMRRRHARLGHTAGSSDAAQGTAFALLGLLIAFTFAGAAGRFDDRRALIMDEANIIGTTYLRLDLLPDSTRVPLQALFRRYVESRLAIYEAVPDMALVAQRLGESEVLQGEIWSGAVRATGEPGVQPRASMLLLPSINEMLDITATRTAATKLHPPQVIYGLLVGAALLCALIVGYELGGTAERRWLPLLVYAVVVSAAIAVSLDLEYPRLGLVRVDAMDSLLVEVRSQMGDALPSP